MALFTVKRSPGKNLLKLDWLEKPGRWKRHPFVDENRKRKT
jgi:hypothetical protein